MRVQRHREATIDPKQRRLRGGGEWGHREVTSGAPKILRRGKRRSQSGERGVLVLIQRVPLRAEIIDGHEPPISPSVDRVPVVAAEADRAVVNRSDRDVPTSADRRHQGFVGQTMRWRQHDAKVDARPDLIVRKVLRGLRSRPPRRRRSVITRSVIRGRAFGGASVRRSVGPLFVAERVPSDAICAV